MKHNIFKTVTLLLLVIVTTLHTTHETPTTLIIVHSRHAIVQSLVTDGLCR